MVTNYFKVKHEDSKRGELFFFDSSSAEDTQQAKKLATSYAVSLKRSKMSVWRVTRHTGMTIQIGHDLPPAGRA